MIPDVPPHRFGYVILSHRRPERVRQLVARIRELSPRAVVLVRHDTSRGPIDTSALASSGAHVLTSSQQLRWGDWSLVTAALEGFGELRRREDPDWYVLVSGQDWPTAGLAEWEAGLAAAQAADSVKAQVNAAPIPASSKAFHMSDQDHIRSRYTFAWYALPRLPLREHLPTIVPRVVMGIWFRTLGSARLPVLLNRLPRDLG